MKRWGAIDLVEDQMRVYSNYRTANGYVDNLLLSSSRKALVSLRDSRLNTLLLQFKNADFREIVILRRKFEEGKRIVALWKNIAPFLR